MIDAVEYKTCCFTGHRSLPANKLDDIRNLLARAVEELAQNGCLQFVSGGAVGFDTLAAETVIEQKKLNPNIRLFLLLPCRDQDAKWNMKDRLRYKKILDSADGVEYVCDTYITGCMHLRNKKMVERADICVAFCQKRGGGTEYTMDYAVEKERTIINIAQML